MAQNWLQNARAGTRTHSILSKAQCGPSSSVSFQGARRVLSKEVTLSKTTLAAIQHVREKRQTRGMRPITERKHVLHLLSVTLHKPVVFQNKKGKFYFTQVIFSYTRSTFKYSFHSSIAFITGLRSIPGKAFTPSKMVLSWMYIAPFIYVNPQDTDINAFRMVLSTSHRDCFSVVFT